MTRHWVPPVTVRGLDHRTEDYSLHPLQHKAGTIPYWTVLNKINPVVGATNHPLSRKIYKGHLDRGNILSCLGMTQLTLLHIPSFSVIPICWGLRLSVTFLERFHLECPSSTWRCFASIHPYKSVPGSNGTEGTIPTTSILEISSGLVATSPCTSLLHLRLRTRFFSHTKRTNQIEVVFEK